MLQDSLTVRVLDASGRPIVGARVKWTAPDASGSVAPAVAISAQDGITKAVWSLGLKAGAQTVTAEADGATPTTFEALVRPGTPATVVASARSVLLRPGAEPVQLTARAMDRGSNVVAAEPTWVSLDTAIVAVSSKGLARPQATGGTRLVATAGSAADTVTVLVERSVNDENTEAGTGEWFTTYSNRAASSDLSLWASPYSAQSGDSLTVYIHSAARSVVSVSVYRLGWYGGAGGKRVWQNREVTAEPQQACTPAEPGPVECQWKQALQIPVSSAWTSGIYLIKVTSPAGKSAAYPLVIRSRAAAAFTVVIPQFTWQAYNAFGGQSLYTSPTAGKPGTRVSFERPYDVLGGATYLYNAGYSNEISVIRWIERSGYDVNYVSDVDLAEPALTFLEPRKGLIFAGHDEYWTWDQFSNVQRMRDAGKHLTFLSGNNAYWNVRLESGAVTGRKSHRIACFKSAADPEARRPEETTTRFRDAPLNRPENALYGIMYTLGASSTLSPLIPSQPGGGEGAGFLAAAGLAPGESVPGLVGIEGDQIVSNGKTPANLQVLFRSPFVPNSGRPSGEYLTTFFVAPSGAGVFASGNNEFGRALDGYVATANGAPSYASPAVQRMMGAVIEWMSVH